MDSHFKGSVPMMGLRKNCQFWRESTIFSRAESLEEMNVRCSDSELPLGPDPPHHHQGATENDRTQAHRAGVSHRMLVVSGG